MVNHLKKEALELEKDRQTRSAQIEAQIQSLEERIKAMEDSFDQATPLETYQEYAELRKKVDQLYQEWGG